MDQQDLRGDREHLYRSVFETAREGMWVLDADACTELINARMAEMLGYSPQEMLGQHISRFFPDIADSVSARFEQLRAGEASQEEVLLRHRDGSAMSVLVARSPLYSQDGVFMGGVGIFTDITARKEAERESLFHAGLLGAVSEGVIVTDADWRITYWNRGAERLYGWRAEEVLGQNVLDVVPSEPSVEQAKEIMAHLAAGKSWSGEFIARRRDGSDLLVAVSDTPMLDENGALVGLIGISSDLTEHHELRKGRERLVALLDASPDFVAIGDTDARILYMNRAGRAMTGVGPDEDLADYDAVGLHPPSWAETLQNTVLPTAAKEGVWRGQGTLVDRDGHEVSVDQVVVAHYGTDGSVEFFSTVARDITELEALTAARDTALRATRQANARAAQQAAVADLGGRALAGIDHDILMDEAVAAVAAGLETDGVALFELKTSEELVPVAATGCLAAVRGADRAPAGSDSQLRYTIALGSSVVADDLANDHRFAPPPTLIDVGLVSGLCVLVRVSGSCHGVLATYSSQPRRFSAEDVNFVQAVANVVATAIERRRHEAAQDQLHRQARLAAVGQLAAGVAHDFNNIVAAISLYAELLETEPGLGEAGHSYVAVVRQQVERGASLVWQVLDFAHRSSLELVDIDLARLVERLVPLLRRTLPVPVTITVIHDGLPYWVRADTTRLQQIFMNLVSNANHAIDGVGRITISLFRHGVDGDQASPLDNPLRRPTVRVDIDDSGAGMAATVLTRAFEPFFTTKSPGQGTGLGLAQVHGLIAQHDGHIDVSSTPGIGTTVSFWLPTPETPGPAPTPTDTATNQPSDIPKGRGEPVLVVDDDPAVRAAMARIVNWLGYTATVAESGETACSILTKDSGSIAVVVSDVRMPGMGGETLAQVIADHWPDIPVILVSGYPNPTSFESPPGAAHTDQPRRLPPARLHKPFSSRQLAAAINVALDR